MKVKITGPYTIKGKIGEWIKMISRYNSTTHLIRVDGQIYQLGPSEFVYTQEESKCGEIGKSDKT